MRTFPTLTAALAALSLGALIARPALAAGPSDSRGPLIHRSLDPSTGATIRLYQLSSSDMTMVVEGRGVVVTKRFDAKESVTTIATRADRISFTLTASHLLVAGPSTQFRLTPANADRETPRLARYVRSSAAYREGVALLKLVKVPARSPLAMLILPTRALLEGAVGDTSARTAMSAWVKSVATKPRIVRVGLQRTPGDCWDAYAQEAIEAWMELEDCRNSALWDGWPWTNSCWVIYDLRAIGAAAWWVKCVGLMT